MPAIPYRSVGHTDLRITPVVIGTMARRGEQRTTRLAIYEAAVQRGLTTFDTAPLYGFGGAERLLGEALRTVPRHTVQILGKVGLRWDAGQHGDVLFEFDDADGRRRQVRRNSRPQSVLQEIEQSLERLGTDYLDLVQIHQPDPRTPIGETMAALLDARGQGLVKEIGVSNFTLAQLVTARRSLGEVPLASLQADYSLLQRRIEPEVLPYCRDNNVGLLAYSPLAAGHLARIPDGSAGALERALRDTLMPMAAAHGVAPAAVAIAWLLTRPGLTAAISGVSTVTQLEEQAGALDVTLANSEAERLTAAFAGIPVPGTLVEGGAARAIRSAFGIMLRGIGLDGATLRRLVGREKW